MTNFWAENIGKDNLKEITFPNGWTLYRTCFACPEQYDLKSADDMVIIAYFRLRHGYFSVSCPDCGDDLVYEAHPEGDGIFATEDERTFHLLEALKAVEAYYNKGDKDESN